MPGKKYKKNQIFLSRKGQGGACGGEQRERERVGEITYNFLSDSVRIMNVLYSN